MTLNQLEAITAQTRAQHARKDRQKTSMEMASDKSVDKSAGRGSGAEDFSAMSNMLGKVLLKMNEDNAKAREMDKMAREMDKRVNEESIKLLADKLEALQLTQLKSLEAQKAIVRTPLPKYAGKAGEFDDWKQGVLTCIKSNDWTDEKRVLEVLPSALSGQAHQVYTSFTNEQKSSLEALFSALKQSLEPEGKAHNRELFVKAKRNPGESMRAFISRCNVYITRADEIDNVADSTWANPFVVEKIYANLSHLDRKFLKNSMGKSEDVQQLCEKADELLSMSEEVVGSCDQNESGKIWQMPPPTTPAHPQQYPHTFVHSHNQMNPWQGWGMGPRPNGTWQRNGRTNPHTPRPGGGRGGRGGSWGGGRPRSPRGQQTVDKTPLN